MSAYNIREATLNDIDFIAEAIVEAEKSGSNVFSYSTIFNLKEAEVREILHRMLAEEIDGCEFSISSYLIAETADKPAGTIGAWVEHNERPSSIIKANLFGYFLPKSSLLYASQQAKIISEFNIEHIPDALSLVVVYIRPEHRGNHLMELLMNKHIKRNKGVQEVAIQVLANNIYAIKSYEKCGFKKCFEKKCDDEMIMKFLPYNEKILMKKNI